MKRLTFILLTVIICLSTIAETMELELPKITEYPRMELAMTALSHMRVNGKDFIIMRDWDRGYLIREYDFDQERFLEIIATNINANIGVFESQILFPKVNDDNVYAYSPTTNKTSVIIFDDLFWADYRWSSIWHYQFDQYYIQSSWNDVDESPVIELLDLSQGTKVRLSIPRGYNLVAMSDDKMHLILKTTNRSVIYNIQKEEIVADFPSDGQWPNDYYRSVFLTNSIIAYPVSNDNFIWGFYDLDSEQLINKILLTNEKGTFHGVLNFSHDLKKALGNRSSGVVLTDTTPLYNYLDSLGLLFHSTTGRSTVNRLRVRENPNLEAQTYGYLGAGDEVEVLDRSGIQVEIGDMKDYWYKIRNAEGLEGWAYGFFLELDEPAEDEE